MVLVFKKVKEKSVTTNYHHLSLLSVFNKRFEKRENNGHDNNLKKCSLLSCKKRYTKDF